MAIVQPSPNPAERSGWQGQLDLIFSRQGDTTQLSHSQAQAPLKIQRPFYPEGPTTCHTVLLHTAGGMVGGDRLSIQVALQPQTQVLLTTAAASKLYRSNGPTTQQTIQVHIAAGAWLEWLPQETIVFNAAQYHQTMRIELAPRAIWLGWDILRFGRTARGELFSAGNWRSHTEVWQSGRPIWLDRQWLPGNEAVFQSPHGLARCPIVGSFALVGQTIDSDVVQQIRATWQAGANPHSGKVGEIGVTRLQTGLLCRYRGHSIAEVRQWFIQVWHLLRATYGSQPPCPPRVWPL